MGKGKFTKHDNNSNTDLYHYLQTAEHLTLATLGRAVKEIPTTNDSGDRSKSTFKEDEDLPTVFRATLSDYFRSGYDRGHMQVL